MIIGIGMPTILQDFLQWRPDPVFLFGLWTGLAICGIIVNVTARVIWKYELLNENPLMCESRMPISFCFDTASATRLPMTPNPFTPTRVADFGILTHLG